ncbi:GntR family transcriptional regulator [Gordonia hydrophobica]|nr:GntR family transcriptional regulator [Gordonia hydrophobica]
MAADGFAGLGNAVQRKGSAQQLADEILGRILGGDISPGTPLRESVVAREAGVARNTVREAIRILVADGLVQHFPNRGAAVCELTGDDVRDLYRVRLMAELEGIRSATGLSPAQQATFEQSLAAFGEAAESNDPNAFVAADLNFHTLLVDLAGSPRLDRLYRSITNEVRFGFSLLTAADREVEYSEPLVSEHRAIYQALAGGKLDRCAELLTEHLEHYKCRMADLVERRSEQRPAAAGE